MGSSHTHPTPSASLLAGEGPRGPCEEGLQLGFRGGGATLKGPQRATQGGLVWEPPPWAQISSLLSRKGGPGTVIRHPAL